MMSAVSSNGPIRAAQYLRMSSENQRYSTENQQNAIAEYAQQHGYSIVTSYIDAGKSGLSLKSRDALKQLLSDALAAQRAFDAILVLDVSRWGRFQNPDQAAHYEFLCRQAGVRVVYCGEPFGDDVAPITTIIKHLKRVMAGEYSRELSAKMAPGPSFRLREACTAFRAISSCRRCCSMSARVTAGEVKTDGLAEVTGDVGTTFFGTKGGAEADRVFGCSLRPGVVLVMPRGAEGLGGRLGCTPSLRETGLESP